MLFPSTDLALALDTDTLEETLATSAFENAS
jgi:hypothetical protein